MIELRRLRTENNLLRQRVNNLEQETVDLADRLIKEQIERQRESEDRFSLKRDLDSTVEKLIRANNFVSKIQESRCSNVSSAILRASRDECNRLTPV